MGTEDAEGVQAGADVIVEVGGEAVSDAGGFASAEMSTDQESGGDQEEESNGEALEKEEGGLLFLVARFQVGAEQSKLGFEVVSSGQLVHPGADGENVTVEIVAVGELGPAGVFLSGEVDGTFPQGHVMAVGEEFDFGKANAIASFISGWIRSFGVAQSSRDFEVATVCFWNIPNENGGKLSDVLELMFEQGGGVGEVGLIGSFDGEEFGDSPIYVEFGRGAFALVSGMEVDGGNGMGRFEVESEARVVS